MDVRPPPARHAAGTGRRSAGGTAGRRRVRGVVSRSRRPAAAARAAAAVVGVTAALVLTGWFTGIELLTRINSGLPSMKPNTALALLLLATTWATPRIAQRLALGAVIAIAALSLVEYATGWSPGIDFVVHGVSGSGPHPGRMAILTGVSLLVLALARLLQIAGRWPRTVEVSGLAVLLVSGLALLGFLYSVQSLYTIGPLSSMALHTAAALGLLALAVLASVPDGALPWAITGTDAGALLVRRMLPVMLAVPLIALLRLLGQRHNWYGVGFGLAVTTITSMALIGGVTWYTARLLAATDERRERAMTALTIVNADLEERVSERADELEAERGRYAVLVDRQRIAADLHDLVIQRLYAVALNLQTSLVRPGDPAPVDSALDGIDEAIGDLRTSIFELKRRRPSDNLAAALREMTRTAGATLGAEPALRVHGSISRLPDEVAEQLIAVAREAVSNAVRHAEASEISIELTIDEDEVAIAVRDDGVGIAPDVHSTSGLANLRARAEQFGGSCEWRRGRRGGTVVQWRIPFTGPTVPVDLEDRSALDARLVDTLLQVTRLLVADAPLDPVTEVVRAILALVDADAAAVFVEADEQHLRLRASIGLPDGALAVGMLVPRETSLSAHVIDTGELLRIDNAAEVSLSRHLYGELPLGPALIVPVGGSGTRNAALVLARLVDRPQFGAHERRAALVLVRYLRLALDLHRDSELCRPHAVASGA